MMHCLKNCTSGPGRGSTSFLKSTETYIGKARKLLAELFNAEDPSRIIFTLNDTYALNFALKGVLRPGDHVIISCLEHNSIIRPLMALEQFDIKTTVTYTDTAGNLSLRKLEDEINSRTRLIAATHASSVIGNILPIKEIGSLCRKYGLLFLVDSAQTAGILPIDVKEMNISLLAFPGHKGLLGPMGTGGLYIAKGVEMKEIIQGGTGTISESDRQPLTMPDRFESGTPNIPGIAGLSAGVEFINRVGMNKIREHEMKLAEQFIDGIKKIKNVKLYGTNIIFNRVPTIAFNIGDIDSMEICNTLQVKYGISTRGGLHCAPYTHKLLGTMKQGAVRVSIGYFNTEKDIEAAVKAVWQIAKKI